MSDLFLKILEMSVMGSIVILVTLLMRFFLRKSSKKYVMILWAVVVLRLLVPISIESTFSVFNFIPHKVTSIATEVEEETISKTESLKPSASKPMGNVPSANKAPVVATKPVAGINVDGEVAKTEVSKVEAPVVNTNEVSKFSDVEEIAEADVEEAKADAMATVESVEAEESEIETTKVDYRVVLGIIWAAGAALIIGYCAVRFILLKRQLKDATRVEKNVYESEKVPSPFVFGFIIPKIYIPDVLDRDERRYILMHERTHIKHGDWISKLLGMVVVAVHWFNPLVWLAYALFEQDVEMHCDEHTVANLENDMKQAYTMSIVSYAKKSNKKLYLVAPLSFSKPNFSKREVTNRVKNIINYKKGTKITAIITTLLIISISSACALNSTSETKAPEENETEETAIESAEVETTETTKELWTMPEVDEELPDFIPLTSATDDDYYDDDYFARFDNHIEVKDVRFSLLMEKAAELNGEDDDNSMLYGFYNGFLDNANWKMVVYDKSTGEYESYQVKDDEVQNVNMSFANLDTLELNPETWLMPYEQFSDFPGFVNFELYATYSTRFDVNTYEAGLADDEYAGTVYGFSSDLDYVYMNVASAPQFDYTVDELVNLEVGDVVNVGGRSYEVTSKNFDLETWNGYRLGLGDIDNDGCLVNIPVDEDGNPVGYNLLDIYGSRLVENYKYVKVPVAEDAEFIFFSFDTNQETSITRDTLADFFADRGNLIYGMGIYTDGGYAFDTGLTVGYYNLPVVIENGEVTDIAFYY